MGHCLLIWPTGSHLERNRVIRRKRGVREGFAVDDAATAAAAAIQATARAAAADHKRRVQRCRLLQRYRSIVGGGEHVDYSPDCQMPHNRPFVDTYKTVLIDRASCRAEKRCGNRRKAASLVYVLCLHFHDLPFLLILKFIVTFLSCSVVRSWRARPGCRDRVRRAGVRGRRCAGA